MQEERTVDEREQGPAGEQGDLRGLVPRPGRGSPGAAGGQAGPEHQGQAREAGHEGQGRVPGRQVDPAGGAADAGHALGDRPGLARVDDRDRRAHEGGSERRGQDRGPAGAGGEGEHRERRQHGERGELGQHRRGGQGAGGEAPGRAPHRGAGGHQGPEGEGHGREVCAHHGGPAGDRGRGEDQGAGGQAPQGAVTGPYDRPRREPGGQRPSQGGHPQPGLPPAGAPDHLQGGEEERRLRGEDLGSERGAARQGPGARGVDALVELRRGHPDVPPQQEARQREQRRDRGRLGRDHPCPRPAARAPHRGASVPAPGRGR